MRNKITQIASDSFPMLTVLTQFIDSLPLGEQQI